MSIRYKSILIPVSLLIIFLGWWLSDLPIGYYEFKKICETEGGLRGYIKVTPNVGWEVSSLPDAKSTVSSYSTVPFVRFPISDSSWKDVRYLGGNPWWSESYEIKIADEIVAPGYRLERNAENVTGAIRLRKEVTTLVDKATHETVFDSARFIYTWTTPENTLFGQSGTVTCPTYKNELVSIGSFLGSTK